MPCSKGMRGCRLDCAHRRFVLDYVGERDAQAVRAENATGGHATELADYYAQHGRVTFAGYLTTHAGVDYPYPRVDAPIGAVA